MLNQRWLHKVAPGLGQPCSHCEPNSKMMMLRASIVASPPSWDKLKAGGGSSTGVLACTFRRCSSDSSSTISLQDQAATSIKEPINPAASAAAADAAAAAMLPYGVLYSDTATIRCYEVSTNRRASIQTIANLLQEVACNQVKALGFSTDGFATTLSMRKHHLIWVTSRMHIEMDQYPLWGEEVQVQTWFQERNRGSTRRDWLISDVKTGRILGRATSTWVMMSQELRKMAKVSEEVREEYVQYALNPPKYAFPEDHPTYNKHPPRLQTRMEPVGGCLKPVVGLKPRRGDLDMNQHVNNVTYIGWMLESLPASLENTHDLQCIVIEFKRECMLEDSIDTMAALDEKPLHGDEDGDQCFVHRVTLSGGKEIILGRTRWRKRVFE